jgi:hypothetical protein
MTKSTNCAFKPSEQDKDPDIEDEAPKPPIIQPSKAVIQYLKAKVQPLKAATFPPAINPIDDSDNDLTPPPETPAPETPKFRRSGRTAANISRAMVSEQGRKTYHAALDAEDAEQYKEAISKEMVSKESHEVFTFVDKVPEGASVIGSCWVMGRRLMPNGTIDKWKVRLVGCGDLQRPGDYNDITSPGIVSASIRLALGIAAKQDHEIAVLDIPTALLGCSLHETLYMYLPDGEWPDPYGWARPLVKLNKTLYAIKQMNREYYKDFFDFIVDDLNLHASIADPGLLFGGNLEAIRILIPVYINDIMSIGKLVLVASIASRLYD